MVNLDGTICEQRFPGFGPPIAGVRRALRRLKEAGYWIVIHSTRTGSHYKALGIYKDEVNSPEAIESYLKLNDIPYDEVFVVDKIPAVAYIDDRAMRLTGDRYSSNWEKIADALTGAGGEKEKD